MALNILTVADSLKDSKDNVETNTEASNAMMMKVMTGYRELSMMNTGIIFVCYRISTQWMFNKR